MADFNPSNPSAAPVEPPEKHSEEFPMEIFRRALIAVFFVALLFPAAAAAHPMGNFSINHYSKLTLEERSIHVHTYRRAMDRIPLPEFATGLAQVYERMGRNEDAKAQYDLVHAIEQLYRANGVSSERGRTISSSDAMISGR
jgi:hypothetical protein